MISRVSILLLCAIASKGVEAFAPSAKVTSRQASALSSTEVDISIPYDATVELAYEASEKSLSYEEFKPKYLAEAIQEVIAKKEAREPKESGEEAQGQAESGSIEVKTEY